MCVCVWRVSSIIFRDLLRKYIYQPCLIVLISVDVCTFQFFCIWPDQRFINKIIQINNS